MECWLANGKHEYTEAGNMKSVPRRLIVEISSETLTNSMKSCGLALAVDGTQDGFISCFKEGRKCEAGRSLLVSQMQLFTDGELHKNLFQISEEDMADAAPIFNIVLLMKMILMRYRY